MPTKLKECLTCGHGVYLHDDICWDEDCKCEVLRTDVHCLFCKKELTMRNSPMNKYRYTLCNLCQGKLLMR